MSHRTRHRENSSASPFDRLIVLLAEIEVANYLREKRERRPISTDAEGSDIRSLQQRPPT